MQEVRIVGDDDAMQEGRIVGDDDARGRPRVRTFNDGVSETVQSDAHLADIHQILEAYGVGGQSLLDETALNFADVSEFGDYHDVMMEVRRAETAFMALDPRIRSIFKNSVEHWLDTAHDEDKRDELVKAGFLDAVEVDTTGGEGRAGGAAGEAETVTEEETSE